MAGPCHYIRYLVRGRPLLSDQSMIPVAHVQDIQGWTPSAGCSSDRSRHAETSTGYRPMQLEHQSTMLRARHGIEALYSSLAPAEQAMTNQALAGLGAIRTPADEVALPSLKDRH